MVGSILTGVVALIHVYILVLEMFLWETKRAMSAFGVTPEFARSTKVLAANQGLYNGFLAAGLVWGIAQGEAGDPIKAFFLVCVAIYGAATASRRIVMVQTVPAAIALVAVWLW